VPPVGAAWLGLTCFWQRPDRTVDRPDHWPSSVGTVPKSGNSTAGFVVSLPELARPETSFGKDEAVERDSACPGSGICRPRGGTAQWCFSQADIGWRSSSIRWRRAGRAKTWGRSPFDDAPTRARQTARVGKRSRSAWGACELVSRGCVARPLDRRSTAALRGIRAVRPTKQRQQKARPVKLVCARKLPQQPARSALSAH